MNLVINARSYDVITDNLISNTVFLNGTQENTIFPYPFEAKAVIFI